MDIGNILKDVNRIAVIGISDKPGKAGQYVPAYLQEQGFTILGVRPGGPLQASGLPIYPSVAAIPEPVDLVLLFRRSEDVSGHLDDILQARPKVVWMQSGIRNPQVAERLKAEGMKVVQDRCLMVEHQLIHAGS